MDAEFDVSIIGNVFESERTVPLGNAVILLYTYAVERPGVIFAYRVHIADADVMLVLQLWRPVTSSNQTEALTFRLIDEVHFSPTRTGQVDVSHTTCNNFCRAMRSLEGIVALLPWRSSVCPSVRLSGTGVDCDHTVHVIADDDYLENNRKN